MPDGPTAGPSSLHNHVVVVQVVKRIPRACLVQHHVSNEVPAPEFGSRECPTPSPTTCALHTALATIPTGRMGRGYFELEDSAWRNIRG